MFLWGNEVWGHLGNVVEDILQPPGIQRHDLWGRVHLRGCALDCREVDRADIADVLREDHVWAELGELGGIEGVESRALGQGLRRANSQRSCGVLWGLEEGRGACECCRARGGMMNSACPSTFETSVSICFELTKVRREAVRTGTPDADAG